MSGGGTEVAHVGHPLEASQGVPALPKLKEECRGTGLGQDKWHSGLDPVRHQAFTQPSVNSVLGLGPRDSREDSQRNLWKTCLVTCI